MFRSFAIGAPFGVCVRIQGLFVAFFALVLGYTVLADGWRDGLWFGFVFVAAFTFVWIHEMAHALVAKRCGATVVDVTIWPLGGMARLEDVPDSARVEAWIAAAGPAANAVAAAVAFGLAALVDGPTALGGALYLAGWINVLLATFNAVPAFPLDGGRLVRAALTPSLGLRRATIVSIWISRVVCCGLAIAACAVGLPLLALIAVAIVVIGARPDGLETEVSPDEIGP